MIFYFVPKVAHEYEMVLVDKTSVEKKLECLKVCKEKTDNEMRILQDKNQKLLSELDKVKNEVCVMKDDNARMQKEMREMKEERTRTEEEKFRIEEDVRKAMKNRMLDMEAESETKIKDLERCFYKEQAKCLTLLKEMEQKDLNSTALRDDAVAKQKEFSTLQREWNSFQQNMEKEHKLKINQMENELQAREKIIESEKGKYLGK